MITLVQVRKIERALRVGEPVAGPMDVARALRSAKLLVEAFVAVYLDVRNRVKCTRVIHVGTVDGSIVHPREVFAHALKIRASSVVVSHNHPSGDPTPSAEDEGVTARLRAAGELVGIALLDHVVVGDPGYRSLRDMGRL